MFHIIQKLSRIVNRYNRNAFIFEYYFEFAANSQGLQENEERHIMQLHSERSYKCQEKVKIDICVFYVVLFVFT